MNQSINRAIHALARRVGIDYMRYTPNNFATLRRARILEDLEIDLVLDVGANVGGYGLELRKMGYCGRIISFEPLSQAYEQLYACSQQAGQWESRHVAVGNQIGAIKINVSGRHTSSSLLPMTREHTAVEGASGYVATEEVEISTLDALVSEEIGRSTAVYLKADVQGFEKQVLEGARNILPQIMAIELELSLVKLYESAPLIDEMLVYLRERGYYGVSLDPAMTNPKNGHVMQINGIFLKSNATTSRMAS